MQLTKTYRPCGKENISDRKKIFENEKKSKFVLDSGAKTEKVMSRRILFTAIFRDFPKTVLYTVVYNVVPGVFVRPAGNINSARFANDP